jgi:hypothetical protein
MAPLNIGFKLNYLLMLDLGVLTKHIIYSNLARLYQAKVFKLLSLKRFEHVSWHFYRVKKIIYTKIIFNGFL